MSDQSSAAEPSQSQSSRQKEQNTGQELFACKACLGYHYVEKCIYNMRWREWLEYHDEHMPSEPVPEYVRNKGADPVRLREHVREMDDSMSGYRHVTVPNTKLKADLMTQSSKDMLLEEQQRVAAERQRPAAERRPQRQVEYAREVERAGVVEEGSEDELA